MTISASELLTRLSSQLDDMVYLLKELVILETPSDNAEAQEEIFAMLIRELREAGMYTHRFPGKKSGGFLFAKPRARTRHKPIQMLVGHCDTVWPIGTLEQMPLEIDAETIKGPGVFDMKAGLTQIVFALKLINELNIELPVDPVVLINSDEEIGSKETKKAVHRLARIADRAMVLEPPLGLSGKLKTARKGIGRFSVIVKGKAAHAGLDPGKGVSAIVELSHQIQKLFAMNDPEKGITVNVGMIEGGVTANVVAPESSAVIDVRVLTQEDAESITRRIYALEPTHPEVKLEIRGAIGRPPMEQTDRNKAFWELARRSGEQLGIDLGQATAGGGSDGNYTSLYTATLDGLGTTGDGAHAPYEFIYTDKLAERTALLALLLMQEPISQN